MNNATNLDIADMHLHIVGIGGIGMSGIAKVLLTQGFTVSGSDLRRSEPVEALERAGARVFIGHAAENIEGATAVVISSAVKADNPEVVEARRRRIPVVPRAEMLAELMRFKAGIAVAGTHGKTTTTSLVGWLLAQAGLDPTLIIGGKVNAFGTNAVLGRGKYLVAEADESDGTFLHLTPTVAVVTNIDPEHLDHYGTFEALQEAFHRFVQSVPFYGRAVVCVDHPVVQQLLPDLTRPVTTYGFSAAAQMRAKALGSGRFQVTAFGQDWGIFELPLPGKHNVLNALAALGVGHFLKLDVETMRAALASFGGVGRRFEPVGERDGVTVIDDYGHHPKEVEAALEAGRERFGDRRLVVCFQPHRYSRTHDLFEDFCRAFNHADCLLVMPIYAAGESPIEGIDSQALVEGIRAHGHPCVELAPEDPQGLLDATLKSGDVLITLGAGSVTQVGRRWVGGHA